MITLTVREGNTGILYLRKSGQLPSTADEELFIPNYDLDTATELLREFQELRQFDGRSLKSSYQVGRYNWYPAMVSHLFWQVFFPYVKYQALISKYLRGEIRFQWRNKGTFRSCIRLWDGQDASSIKARLHYSLLKYSNRLIVRRNPTDLLYLSFGRSDFRSREIRQELQRTGPRFIEVVPPTSFLNMIGNILRGGKDYYYGREPTNNRFRYSYDFTSIPTEKRKLFQAAIRVVERSITSYLIEYEDHLKALGNCTAHTFYGLDDINGYIFPLLYACRTRGIRTIGHQHGAYVKRHVGYVMPGIAREEFSWFDNVIVWGEYWKEKLLKASELYTPDFFIIGANKFRKTYSVSHSHSERPTNVLIPYEFLTNTFKVGQYMQRMIDLGYNIFFKPRPDEEIIDQLDAYCLPAAYRDRLTIVTNLDDAALEQIDIVAGTMTTLVYELLPCGKIIWILETEYRHLDDLIDEGLAHKVRLESLKQPGGCMFKATLVKPEFFFGHESLEETLRRHVLLTK